MSLKRDFPNKTRNRPTPTPLQQPTFWPPEWSPNHTTACRNDDDWI